ncbi:glycosyltransferase family 2 protein [Bilifractor sp. LCP21S3_A7]|uniref:glycosyltransferase family 2 protein n=1 Tax=Bilifractor sp. LCP21S3_A7 TaxID=3438738 RepID=UPI003F8E3F88
MISVLINNHNHGEFIGEAIESVLNQTYQDFELIIVDGDSTDNSRSVIFSYLNKRPDKITAVMKPTSGQAAAFNVGFKLAKGDIIAFLDSDDYFFPNKLERLAELHKEYPFIGHSRMSNTSKDKIIKETAPQGNVKKRDELYHKYGYIYTYHLITSCMSGTREIMEKILPMPEDGFMTFADCYVKCFAQNYCDIHYVDEPLSFYRRHNKMANITEFGKDDQNQHFMHLKLLYEKAFNAINKELEKRHEPTVPIFSFDREAFKLSDPSLSIEEGKTYALYGAGNNFACAKREINAFNAKVLFAADSNPAKWGGSIDGTPIVSPEEMIRRRSEFEKVYIASLNYKDDIEKNLIQLGLTEGKDFGSFQEFPWE